LEIIGMNNISLTTIQAILDAGIKKEMANTHREIVVEVKSRVHQLRRSLVDTLDLEIRMKEGVKTVMAVVNDEEGYYMRESIFNEIFIDLFEVLSADAIIDMFSVFNNSLPNAEDLEDSEVSFGAFVDFDKGKIHVFIMNEESSPLILNCINGLTPEGGFEESVSFDIKEFYARKLESNDV
jgi:hypothetical protein